MSKMTNIHDYLEAIGSEPPPIEEKLLAEAKKKIIWAKGIEEVPELLQELEAWEEVNK